MSDLGRAGPAGAFLLENVGPGTWTSSSPLWRGAHNAVVVEAIPLSGGGSATLQLLDGDRPGGLSAVVDSAGLISGMSAVTKRLVVSVLQWVGCQLTVSAGNWSVYATPLDAPNQTTLTASVSGTLGQGAPAAAANAWPIKVTDGATVAAVSAAGLLADTELPAAAALSDVMANPTAPLVGAVLAAWDGAALQRLRMATTYKTIAAVAVVAGTPQTVWTPTAGKKFRLMFAALSLSVAGAVLLLDQAAEMIRTPTLLAAAPFALPDLGNGRLSSVANNLLRIDVTANGNVSGFVAGMEE